MTSCLTCWRNSTTGPRCDTCTKGDGLNAPMKPWDGSHPPPKEEDETMTDYTERFRTLSIPQMQQVLAFLCNQLRGEMLASGREAEATFDLGVSCILRGIDNPAEVTDKPPSRIIRSGDLVVGKRYRVVEIADWDISPRHKIGDEVTAVSVADERDEAGLIFARCQDLNGREAWFASDGQQGTYVTAVELVEDETEDEDNSPRRHTRECNGESDPDGGGVPCDCGGIDQTIIRAAEGVTLEPGEYEAPDTHHFTVAVALSAEREPMFGVWGWFVASWSQWVYAVRRVDPKPSSEPDDGRSPFQKRNNLNADGTMRRDEPVAPAAGGDREPLCEKWCGNCRDTFWMYTGEETCPKCSPPQQQAERVEPVAETKHVDGCKCSAHEGDDFERVLTALRDDEGLTYAGPCLERIRGKLDAALATVAKLNALLGLGDVPDEPAEYAPSGYGEELERVVSILMSADWDVEKTVSAAVARLVAQVNEERATVAKLTAELEAAKRAAFEAQNMAIEVTKKLEAAEREACDYEKESAKLRERADKAESARAGLDPKACGELIARVNLSLNTSHAEPRAPAIRRDARDAISELVAMLGVEVAGG